jgi:large subunit ribosomal protein L2
MGLKKFKPITPTLRYRVGHTFEEITAEKPYKPLTIYLKESGGRNNLGRVTNRHQGSGHKQKYRIIDFLRHDKANMLAKVETIEYDPNRTGRIALVCYEDGVRRYILAPDGLKVGDKIQTGINVPIKTGNCLPLRNMPLATTVHNVEMRPGKGAQMVRTAGAYAELLAKEGSYALLKLPSGEMRKVFIECYATVGRVSNEEHTNIVVAKAGRSRWLGKRPHVRGVAMNPHDHPMGGGEGKSSGGRHPCSPWGWITKGKRTRNKRKNSSKLIVKRRYNK